MENNAVSTTQKLTKAEKAEQKELAAKAKAESRRAALIARIAVRCEVLGVPMEETVEVGNEALETLLKNLKKKPVAAVEAEPVEVEPVAVEPVAEVEPVVEVEVEPVAAETIAPDVETVAAPDAAEVTPGETVQEETKISPTPSADSPERSKMLAECIAAVRADKKIGAGTATSVGRMTDEDLTARLAKTSKGRSCTPPSAVSWFKALEKKLASGETAA